MGKHISTKNLLDTLDLSKCTDGFWLYDTTRGMNLSMRAKTEEEAFVDAIKYYQNRLTFVEGQLADITKKVDSFVEQIQKDEDN